MKTQGATVREIQMTALSPLMEEILTSGGAVELTVTGNSMYPMLCHRKSQVRLISPTALQIGDIPLYRRDNGAYILHRIVGTVEDTDAHETSTYICCGDHQWHTENGIRRDQILAVVTDFKRRNRWVSCKDPAYRIYTRFWIANRPLRRLVFGGFRRIKRLIFRKK